MIGTVLFLSSCGQNNPATSSTQGLNNISFLSGKNPSAFIGNAPVTNPPSGPLPDIFIHLASTSSYSIPILLEASHVNTNASGILIPAEQLMGDYLVDVHTSYASANIDNTGTILSFYTEFYIETLLNYTIIKSARDHTSSLTWTIYDSGESLNSYFLTVQEWQSMPYCSYNINMTFVNGILLPLDTFTNCDPFGFPAGIYIMPDMSMYGKTLTGKANLMGKAPDGYTAGYYQQDIILEIKPASQTVVVGQTASFSAIAHCSDGSTQDVTDNIDTSWSTQISGFPNTNPPGTAVAYMEPTTGMNALSTPNAATAPTTNPQITIANKFANIKSDYPGQVMVKATHKGVPATGILNVEEGSILIEPHMKTTVYLHNPPLNDPASLKKQYNAFGLNISINGVHYTNGQKIANNMLQWKSSEPAIAAIDTTGQATALKPGSTAITANLSSPNISSNEAELYVEYWKYTHIRQNADLPTKAEVLARTGLPDINWPSWVDVPYAKNWGPRYIYNKQGNIIDTIYDVDLGPRTSLDVPPYSIGGKGCHMVCAAMVLSTLSGQPMNLVTLNNSLNTDNGYYPSNAPKWNVIKGYSNGKILGFWQHNYENKNASGVVTWTQTQSFAIIDGALANGNMVVLRVDGNNGHYIGHFVLAVSGSNGDYKIYDPAYRVGDDTPQLDKLSKHYHFSYGADYNFNIITVQH